VAGWPQVVTMPLYIVEKKQDDVLVLDLRGRLTLGAETAELRSKLNELVEAGHRKIVLTLREVTYVDSSGLAALIACYTTVRKHGGDLKLAHLTTRIRDLLQITRLSTVFENYSAIEDAVASFRAAP
jgi:anti-sigma B factor antagonist